MQSGRELSKTSLVAWAMVIGVSVVLLGSDTNAADYQIPTKSCLIKFGLIPPDTPVGRLYKLVSKAPIGGSLFELPDPGPTDPVERVASQLETGPEQDDDQRDLAEVGRHVPHLR